MLVALWLDLIQTFTFTGSPHTNDNRATECCNAVLFSFQRDPRIGYIMPSLSRSRGISQPVLCMATHSTDD